MPIFWEIPDFPSKGTTMKVEVQSAQWGGYLRGGGAASGLSEVVVTREHDKYSTHIFSESLKGEGRLMTIYFMSSSGNTVHTYLTYELHNTLISSYSLSGGDKPVESISLNFGKIIAKTEPAPKI